MTSWDRKKAPGRPPMSSSRSPPLYTAPSARGPIFTGRAEAHGAPWCWRALLLLRMVECRSRAHRSRRCAVGAPPNGAEQIAARRAAAKCRARAAACGVERVDLPVGQPREEARRDDGDRVCLREGAELHMDFASGSEPRAGRVRENRIHSIQQNVHSYTAIHRKFDAARLYSYSETHHLVADPCLFLERRVPNSLQRIALQSVQLEGAANVKDIHRCITSWSD